MIRKKNIEKNLDSKISALFHEGVDNITLKPSIKQQLFDIPDKQEPLSPIAAFLEKEIRIPVISVPALALSLLVLITVSLNSLVFPGEIPKEKYEIIELKFSDVSLHESIK